MQMFGLGWLAVQLAAADGSLERAPLFIGLIGLARATPALTLSLVAGAIVDRTDRRRVLLITQAISAGLTAVLAALTVAGVVTIGIVMALSALIGMSSAFDAPARQSMLQRLVPPAQMMNAIGLQSAVVHGTGVIGPALGGLLIGPIGVGGLLFANAVGYLPVMGAIILMAPMPAVAGAGERGVLRSVADGLQHVARDPILRPVFLVGVAVSLLARPYLQLLPAFVVNHLHLGAPELSLLLSVTGFGAMLGALAVASLGAVGRRGLLYLIAAVATSLLLAVLGAQSDVVSAAVVAFALAFAVLAFMSMSSTIMQTTTPERLLGRVMSVHTTLWMGVMPLGQLLLGAVASVIGVDQVYVGGGILTFVVSLGAVWRARALRDLRAPVGAESATRVAASAAD
jgi:MFS family permease